MNKNSYKNLFVWQKSIDLVVLIYKLTDQFPLSEQFNLTSQMRRAVISIPSNIAEGSKRGTEKEFKRFLSISFGSGGELETQIEVAKRLNFVKIDNYSQVDSLLEEVMKMLNKMTLTKNY